VFISVSHYAKPHAMWETNVIANLLGSCI